MLIFFFLKQKTAYEMRISDWSSDVCSSDLQAITGMNESKARLDEIEQKMARKGSGEGDERKSLGEMATEGKEAEIAALASSRGRVSMEVKAIISSLTTDANGS